MKKNNKIIQIIALLLALFAVGQVWAQNSENPDDPPKSGYCGYADGHVDYSRNVMWEYNSETTTLRIFPNTTDPDITAAETYAMNSFDGDRPWERFKEDITTVVIEDGVTRVGEFAFVGLKKLTKVSLPASVRSIDFYAFVYSGITNIVIPASVDYIGDYAFQKTPLEKIYFLGELTSCGQEMFAQGDIPRIIVRSDLFDDFDKYPEFRNYHYNNFLESGYVVTAGEGITASTEGPLVTAGEIVTLSYNGEVPKGYQLVFSYSYKESFDNDVSVQYIDGNTFQMPASDVTVNAVLKKMLTHTDISFGDIAEKTFSGDPICPEVTVMDGEKKLVKDVDYTVECKDNVNVSAYAKVVFTGIGDYAGETVKTFSIVPEVIHDFAAVQVLKNENGVFAVVDGEYTGDKTVKIAEDISVESVSFNRSFSTGNDGYATMMLPFEVKTSQLSGVGMILQFDSVGTCNGVNTSSVCVSVLWAPDKDEDVDVNANTPYLVQMNDKTLGIDGGVIIKKTVEAVVYDKSYAAEQKPQENRWQFRGMFGYKKWSCGDGELGRVWGYAGEKRNGAKIGQFVKFGSGAWIVPFRAYMYDPSADLTPCAPNPVAAYDAPYVTKPTMASQTVARPSAVAGAETALISDIMDVVIVDRDENGKEHTTVIGRMDKRTGEIRFVPRSTQKFDLKGRKLNGKSTAKGVYYSKKVAP